MTAQNARTVLGVPFLPSPALSVASLRIRDRIRRVHRGLAPPPVQILEAALSLLDHRVLVELCAAGAEDVKRFETVNDY